jgi:ATP-dependent NAD(P)H-hydrate dehydratase
MAADMHMEDAIRRLVPPLSYGARKGQMGRIGVLGGSADFTGAPYYAGMASLKV